MPWYGNEAGAIVVYAIAAAVIGILVRYLRRERL